MTQGEAIAAELMQFHAPTRTLLERIPHDKLAWKPHEKSMTLGRLGRHVAELPHWIVKSFQFPEFDFVAQGYAPRTPDDHAEIMATLEEQWGQAANLLKQASDADLAVPFTMCRGEHVISRLTRAETARHHIKHMIHHRGQLSVYLRLLDVPIPELFGPTADTRR
ncbi:MAG: DinB family protein [Flavobacteriales bacterium]|nr:DinB family protein [Flavobacteriales bacterium]MCL4280869.1 DinB family protein [Flavobacteriales bacterium]